MTLSNLGECRLCSVFDFKDVVDNMKEVQLQCPQDPQLQ